ncbi:MAG: MFS transporter [Dehalococcoidia bacterium]
MPAHTGLWRHPDFLKMWAGQTLAALSSTVTTLALPLLAALTLHASPFEMGLLATAATIPNLLVGLLAGIWVDRLRRRAIMIAADVGRALLLLTIPIADALDLIAIWQLYVVLFLSGVCTTFFDVAHMSYLPSLVGRERLVSANSKLMASTSVAGAVRPGLAGGLIQLLTAPIAIIADAVSLAASAVLLTTIRTREPTPSGDDRRDGAWREALAGVRTLYLDPVLRSFAVSSTIYLFFSSTTIAVYVLYTTRALGIAPGTLGLIFGFGGVGSVVGALIAARFARWLGAGHAMIVANLVGGLCMLLTPLASDGTSAVPLLMTAQFGSQSMGAVFAIIQTSLRQARTPDSVLGRMNASYRFLTMGAIPIGSLVGGALGEAIGLRATLLVGGVGLLLPVVWLVLSPARSLRVVEAEV